MTATKKQATSLTMLLDNERTKSIFASVISIIIGILVGFVVMIILAIANGKSIGNALYGLLIILIGPFSTGNALYSVGNMIFYAVPLIFTGLSVAIAYKTGLFNIGAPGQFLMGTIGSLLIALSINTAGSRFLGILVWILAILVGMILGALWGMIPALFKAFFGVNEVIICIMTNWIAANIASWVFSKTPNLIASGSGKSGYLIKTSETGNYSPTLGLNKIFSNSYIDIGIVLAIIVAIAIGIILNKTTFGYELKACGSNKDAAKYAGMQEKRNILFSMAIAGALSALGAALYYLNPGIEFKWSSSYMALPAYGFNGISAALLASNNPVGVIFSGLIIRYLNIGGDNLASAGFNKYIADLIVAIVIYLAGFSKLFGDLISKKKKEDKMKAPEKPESAKGGK